MKICSMCTGFSITTACSNIAHLLNATFQRDEGFRPTLGVLADPTVVDLFDRHRVQVVVLLPSDRTADGAAVLVTARAGLPAVLPRFRHAAPSCTPPATSARCSAW